MTERQAMWSGRLRLRAIGQYLIASAVGHLLWEIVQLPLYTIGQTGTTATKAFAVIHCTGGDIVIALWTLLAALLVTVSTDWPRSRFMVSGPATPRPARLRRVLRRPRASVLRCGMLASD